MSKKEKLDIVYEDKNLVVVNKPAKLLTVSTDKESEHTLFHKVLLYEKRKNKNNKIFVVHRLDKDTSGLVIFAKSQKMQLMLQKNWNDLVVLRQYVAIVEGVPKREYGIIRSWLKENAQFHVYSFNNKNGKLAITEYRVISSIDKYSLLDIKIKTGRKNQIRVHLCDIGNPIIGDKKYGAKTNPINRMGLHANKLVIINPITNQEMVFEVDIPIKFVDLFK